MQAFIEIKLFKSWSREFCVEKYVNVLSYKILYSRWV